MELQHRVAVGTWKQPAVPPDPLLSNLTFSLGWQHRGLELNPMMAECINVSLVTAPLWTLRPYTSHIPHSNLDVRQAKDGFSGFWMRKQAQSGTESPGDTWSTDPARGRVPKVQTCWRSWGSGTAGPPVPGPRTHASQGLDRPPHPPGNQTVRQRTQEAQTRKERPIFSFPEMYFQFLNKRLCFYNNSARTL